MLERISCIQYNAPLCSKITLPEVSIISEADRLWPIFTELLIRACESMLEAMIILKSAMTLPILQTNKKKSDFTFLLDKCKNIIFYL